MADSETWSVPEEGPLPTRLGKLQSDPVPQHWLSEVSVRQLVTEVDEDLLRGVTLSECLTGCGKHWAMQPASAMLETQQKRLWPKFPSQKIPPFSQPRLEDLGIEEASCHATPFQFSSGYAGNPNMRSDYWLTT